MFVRVLLVSSRAYLNLKLRACCEHYDILPFCARDVFLLLRSKSAFNPVSMAEIDKDFAEYLKKKSGSSKFKLYMQNLKVEQL